MWQAFEAEGANCHHFAWSGGNSHRARMRAAEQLSQHLQRLDPQGVDVPLAVVAHSHGGNAALHAVWRLHGLGEKRIKVVTLATPYFFARRKAKVSALDTFAAIFVGLYLLGLLAAVALLPSEEMSSKATIPFAVAATTALALQFLGWLYFRGVYGPSSNREVQNKVVACIQTPEIPEREKVHDLLVIRAADDEAGGVLGGAQFSGWLGFTGVRLTKPARLILVIFGAGFGLYQLESSGRELFGVDTTPVLWFVVDWTIPAFSILVLLLSIPAISALTHGWDGPATSRFAIVTAEASPPGNSTVWQRQIRDSRANGLAHSSLYDDPLVIRRVIAHALNQESRPAE